MHNLPRRTPHQTSEQASIRWNGNIATKTTTIKRRSSRSLHLEISSNIMTSTTTCPPQALAQLHKFQYLPAIIQEKSHSTEQIADKQIGPHHSLQTSCTQQAHQPEHNSMGTSTRCLPVLDTNNSGYQALDMSMLKSRSTPTSLS